MFTFFSGRKEKSQCEDQSENPKAPLTPNGRASDCVDDDGVVYDKANGSVTPAGFSSLYSYAISQQDDDLPASEISMSITASAYNQYLQIENELGAQSFESTGISGNTPDTTSKDENMSKAEKERRSNMVSNDQRQEAEKSAYYSGSPAAPNGVHAISYVMQAPEQGYVAGNEDDLSTLGDESIIRRGRQNQQKQNELVLKQLAYQEELMRKQKEKGKHRNISKAHTRSTEELSPSSFRSGDLSFTFSNVLDVHEKIPIASHLGHDVLDDRIENKDQRNRNRGKDFGVSDGTGSENTSKIPFFERNKWVIIKFMIIVSSFLLMAAAAVLIVSLLHIKRLAENSTEASIFNNDGEPIDYANIDLGLPTEAPTMRLPPIYNQPDEIEATGAITTSPTSSQTLRDVFDNTFATISATISPTENFKTDAVTMSPTESFKTDIVTQSPTLSSKITIPTATNVPGTVESIVDPEITKISTDLRFVISTFSPSSLPSLEDTGSAQYKAFDWMRNDPTYWSMEIYTIVQRWTLAVLYYSTGGPNWKTELLPDTYAEGKSPWLSYSDECLWESSNQGTRGRICDSDNNYNAIHLRNVGLTGTLPAELGLLSDHIRLFFVNSNELTGTLPTELGQLTALEKINLQYNNFSGNLPSEIGQWSALTIAAMGNNKFSGSLPSELGSWGSVKTIGFEKNNFSGTLPSEFSDMSYIEKLSMEMNSLSGTIPYSYNRMYQLTSLTIQTNDLTGEMQWGLCPGYYNVVDLKADCEEIECDCCSSCFTDPVSNTPVEADPPTVSTRLRAGLGFENP